jgi:hypothetical protein
MEFWPFRGSLPAGKPAPAAVSGHFQELLVVCHGDDPQGQAILENICTALDFAKIRFSILDLQRRSAWPALESFSSIVLCTELIWELESEKASRLDSYIRAGGGMVIAYRCWNEHLSEMLGTGKGASEPRMHLTTGLTFDKEIFPGSSGLTIDDSDWFFQHSRFDIERADLSPDCNILMSDLAGCPILWSRDIGNGRLVYWNTGILFCRALRGFIVQSVLDAMEVGVSAIAGFAMFHIDDFPTSLWDARLEPVTTEFPELDRDSFFFGVWHEDMMALRAKHDLKYTWYAVMNYHDVDNGPGADPLAPAAVSGREILKRRFCRMQKAAEDDEYGFHGYNHEPMTGDSWPDPATLRSKLSLARELWKDTVPAPFPASWVPANNWYHADHVRALKEVFPEISVVCSLFSSGDAEMGEYREFGSEPWERALLCLPRETYGYVLRPELRMMMLSQIAGMGIWTHFLHPDDIYDIPGASDETTYCRNPETLGWRTSKADGRAGLYTQLDEWIAQVRSSYPWLEFSTTSHAEAKYHAHVNNHVDVRKSGEEIEIRSRSEGLFYAKTRKGTFLVAGTGGDVVDRRQLEEGFLHVVRCSAGGGVFYIQDI